MTDPISGSNRTGMGVSGTIPPSFCKIQTSSIHTVKSPKIRLPTPRLPLAHPPHHGKQNFPRENWQFQEGNFSRSCIQLSAIFGSYCLYFLFFNKIQLFILGSMMIHSFDDEKTRVDLILMSHNVSRFAWTLYNIKWFIKIWPIKIQLKIRNLIKICWIILKI